MKKIRMERSFENLRHCERWEWLLLTSRKLPENTVYRDLKTPVVNRRWTNIVNFSKLEHRTCVFDTRACWKFSWRNKNYIEARFKPSPRVFWTSRVIFFLKIFLKFIVISLILNLFAIKIAIIRNWKCETIFW